MRLGPQIAGTNPPSPAGISHIARATRPSSQRPASPLRRGPRDRDGPADRRHWFQWPHPGVAAQIAVSTAVPDRSAETGHLATEHTRRARGWPEPAIPPRPAPFEPQTGPISLKNSARIPTAKKGACKIQMAL
jgi:hypothetical protein